MNIDERLMTDVDRPDERDGSFRCAASVLVLAIDDACDQKPMPRRGNPWRTDCERIMQITEGLRRRAGYKPNEAIKLSIKAQTIDAIAWLFDDAVHPLSAQGIADSMGMDLSMIRKSVKHNPVELRRSLVAERMGLRKMFPRRELEAA